jgi:hypothetical protein
MLNLVVCKAKARLQKVKKENIIKCQLLVEGSLREL